MADIIEQSYSHYILRIADGNNFENARGEKVWGVNSTKTGTKGFVNNTSSLENPENIILWFVKNRNNGLASYCAPLKNVNKREVGELIATPTNDERRWSEGDWDTDVYYSKLYDIKHLEIPTGIRNQNSVQSPSANIAELLTTEYINIRYNCRPG